MVRLPQTTPISTFYVAFHIFVVGEHRLQIWWEGYHSKSQPTDDKLSLKGVWSRHVIHVKFLVSLKYLWNYLSYRLQILYNGCPHDVLAFGLTNSPSSGRGHGHVTSLNFDK